jgi:hypothetical protein
MLFGEKVTLEGKCKELFPCRDKAPNIKYSFVFAVLIIFFVGFLIFAVDQSPMGFTLDPASALALIGTVVFFSTLILADYASPDVGVSTGEMRSAISATIIVVYLVYLAFSLGGKFKPEAAIVSSFTNLVSIVVIFYFGSKGVIEAIKIWKG